tara:strand:- start:35 stop:241 length:207 start_codon:yes stop_codon:yes gene_type:complete
MDAEIGSAAYYAERNEYETNWCNHYKSFRTTDMNEDWKVNSKESVGLDTSLNLADYKKEISNIYERNY